MKWFYITAKYAIVNVFRDAIQCLVQGNDAVPLVRLEPGSSRSQATETVCSLTSLETEEILSGYTS